MKSYIAIALLAVPGLLAASPQSAVVVVPVADVWSRPLAAGEKPADELRETQVLFGEQVLIHESSGTWARIEAIEQPTFRQHSKWEGYPGWILKENLGEKVDYNNQPIWIGRLRAPTKKPLHKGGQALYAANTLLGIPYLWGGLSQEGLDCSGLVHLAYRSEEIRIPRDAHEQWMKAKPIKRAELKPADLIFSAKAENPKKITHVTLLVGNGQVIEAPQSGGVVRTLSFKEKYGEELEKVESGDRVGDRVVYFGSYLH